MEIVWQPIYSVGIQFLADSQQKGGEAAWNIPAEETIYRLSLYTRQF